MHDACSIPSGLSELDDAFGVIKAVAGLEPVPPNPEIGKGRTCYAFCELEDLAFGRVTEIALHLFKQAGLRDDEYAIETDAIGNVFVTVYGQDRERFVLAGSHLDSVLNGGMYDGVAGVNAAMRFLPTAIKQRKDMRYSYKVAVWRAEESSPATGVTCLGSRLATGMISQAQLAAVTYTTGDGKKMSLQAWIEQRYGPAQWAKIVEMIQRPSLDVKSIVAAEELHIEQSGVIAKHRAKLGVVIDGIGSAIRQTMSFPLAGETVSTEGMWEIEIVINGEAAHSGGTPPNRDEYFCCPSRWYRSDALVATARVVEQLARFHDVKLIRIDVPQKTGFTTVPAEQVLHFLVPPERISMVNVILGTCLEPSGANLRLPTKVIKEGLKPTRDIVAKDNWPLVRIPLLVEDIVRKTVLDDVVKNGGVGKVRATVTDFVLTATGFSCNFDLRDVDPAQMEEMQRKIYKALEDLLRQMQRGELKDVLRTVSAKPYAALSRTAAQEKMVLAKSLGFEKDDFIQMPSLPGHDSASLSQAGVPEVTMTFACHDGISHNGRETLTEGDYLSAELVSHAYLRAKLGIVPDLKEVVACK